MEKELKVRLFPLRLALRSRQTRDISFLSGTRETLGTRGHVTRRDILLIDCECSLVE